MSQMEPIEQSSEVCQLFTCIPEKFVVDFANGIDVVRERQRHMAQRTGFFARLYDGFTGQGAQHQAEINASLTDGVEGALTWLVGLSDSVAKSNRAIHQVQQRINGLKQHVATLAHYSAETRQMLERVSQHLYQRCEALEQQVARIDSLQRAHLQFDGVFAKWGAGRFGGLSYIGRCYAVLEELRWGAFGEYCLSASSHEKQQMLESLANRAIIQMSRDASVSQRERIATREHWLAKPANTSWLDGEDAVRYLGDWTSPRLAPLAYAASQIPDELPLHVPRIGSAQRMTEGLIDELFLEMTA